MDNALSTNSSDSTSGDSSFIIITGASIGGVILLDALVIVSVLCKKKRKDEKIYKLRKGQLNYLDGVYH